MESNQKTRVINKQLRRLVWNQYIDSTTLQGECFCCKSIIDYDDFEAGHVQSYSQGGATDLTNLRPICKMCNRSMGSSNLIDYQRQLQLFNKKSQQVADHQGIENEQTLLAIQQLQDQLNTLQLNVNVKVKRRLIAAIPNVSTSHPYQQQCTCAKSTSPQVCEFIIGNHLVIYGRGCIGSHQSQLHFFDITSGVCLNCHNTCCFSINLESRHFTNNCLIFTDGTYLYDNKRAAKVIDPSIFFNIPLNGDKRSQAYQKCIALYGNEISTDLEFIMKSHPFMCRCLNTPEYKVKYNMTDSACQKCLGPYTKKEVTPLRMNQIDRLNQCEIDIPVFGSTEVKRVLIRPNKKTNMIEFYLL